MESSNLSPNCIFMKTKKCNKKLGTTLGDPLRHQNHELKEIQKLHAKTVTVTVLICTIRNWKIH